MCSSVDLPEPDGATSATDCPAQSASLAPSRIVSAASPCKYCRFISWRSMTGTSSAPCSRSISPSLVPQRFDGIEARGAPRRVQCRKERQRQRHDDDGRGLADVDLGGQLRQEIELWRKQLGAGQPGQELSD